MNINYKISLKQCCRGKTRIDFELFVFSNAYFKDIATRLN